MCKCLFPGLHLPSPRWLIHRHSSWPSVCSYGGALRQSIIHRRFVPSDSLKHARLKNVLDTRVSHCIRLQQKRCKAEAISPCSVVPGSQSFSCAEVRKTSHCLSLSTVGDSEIQGVVDQVNTPFITTFFMLSLSLCFAFALKSRSEIQKSHYSDWEIAVHHPKC